MNAPLSRAMIRPGRTLRVPAGRAAAVAAAAVILTVLDRAIYRTIAFPEVESADWYQVLRQLGYVPTWFVVGTLLYLLDRRPRPNDPLAPPRPWKPDRADRPHHHRAGLVVLAAVLAGLAAEVLKLVCRRMRPEVADGLYVFKPLWVEPLSSSGLGLPSSHTAVAFGACGMVAMLLPAIRWPMLALASGCGISRLLAGAHFSTDVLIGAMLGLAVARVLHLAGERPGVPLDRA